MYSSTLRSVDYQYQLLNFINREYSLSATAITPARRGFYGETWRLDTANKRYFVKLDYSEAHHRIYERSFLVIDHLCRHGIDFISRIVKTASDKLFARYDDAVLGIFEWFDGKNIENDATKSTEYQLLAKVYAVPPDGLHIPREDFSGTAASRFFAQWKSLDDARLYSLLEAHRANLERRAARLKHFAALCRSDTGGFVITHGDAGGNLLVNGNEYHLVDWDDSVLAPPERDAWNMLCHKDKRDWAGGLFHSALREQGISYTLRPERLAYYCYTMYFFYLTEYLNCFAHTGTVQGLDEYFTGWAENRVEYADTI